MRQMVAAFSVLVVLVALTLAYWQQQIRAEAVTAEVGGMELPAYYGQEFLSLQDFRALREFMDEAQ